MPAHRKPRGKHPSPPPHRQPFPLLSLPPELRLEVGRSTANISDLSSLTRVSRHLHDLLQPVLLDRALTHITCNTQLPVILWALYQHRSSLIKKLLGRGFPINQDLQDNTGASHPLLYFAVRERRVDLVKVLLASGANAQIDLPLFYLYDEGSQKSMLRILLESGYDPNRSPMLANYRQGPALHVLIESAYLDTMPLEKEALVRMLVKFGADVNLRDEKGRTPLCCIKRERRACRKVLHYCLVELGADRNLRDTNGRLPYWPGVYE